MNQSGANRPTANKKRKATIIHADSLLSGFAGKLPYKVKTNSATGKPMVNDATVLNNYNNNQLTPGCAA